MVDQNDTPVTLAHLPGIYQVTATDPREREGPLMALLHLYETVISGIGATIDDGATYLDPLTTPALSTTTPAPSAQRHSGVPQPTGVATLKTLLIRAKAILASRDYPADRMNQLKTLIDKSELRLVELAKNRATADRLLASAWVLVTDVAASCDPFIAAAASLARRAGMPPETAVNTIKTILVNAQSSRGIAADAHSGRGVLIARAEKLLALIDTQLNELDQSWSLVRELQLYVPPSDPDATVAPDFLAWLGTWVGVDLTEVETVRPDVSLETRRRELVKEAAVLWRHRGTPQGLRVILDAFYGVDVDVQEWVWPQGMRIEHSSTIGLDTALVPDVDLNQSFVVVWNIPEQFAPVMGRGEWRLPLRCIDGNSRRQVRALMIPEGEADPTGLLTAFRIKAQKLHAAINRERPAHAHYYVALGCDESAAIPEPMEIGHSKIGVCLLS